MRRQEINSYLLKLQSHPSLNNKLSPLLIFCTSFPLRTFVVCALVKFCVRHSIKICLSFVNYLCFVLFNFKLASQFMLILQNDLKKIHDSLEKLVVRDFNASRVRLLHDSTYNSYGGFSNYQFKFSATYSV